MGAGSRSAGLNVPFAYAAFAGCLVLASAAPPVRPDAAVWGAAQDVVHVHERGTVPAAPTIPTGYSAYVRQLHYDGVSMATRTRYFAMYHDFPLKMQRLDHSADAFAANASDARAEKLIQRYGRSWGDRCGGTRLLLEPFFNETRCYSLAIPSTDCLLAHDFPALPSHLPSDYALKFKEKRPSPAGILYIWTATEFPTACPNGASLRYAK